tara:strand:+ start:417 stop:617 length:201 start_codon:yes stop_codon:yes gene_type:complete
MSDVEVEDDCGVVGEKLTLDGGEVIGFPSCESVRWRTSIAELERVLIDGYVGSWLRSKRVKIEVQM